jgi:hypothetical protein
MINFASRRKKTLISLPIEKTFRKATLILRTVGSYKSASSSLIQQDDPRMNSRKIRSGLKHPLAYQNIRFMVLTHVYSDMLIRFLSETLLRHHWNLFCKVSHSVSLRETEIAYINSCHSVSLSIPRYRYTIPLSCRFLDHSESIIFSTVDK